MALTNYVTHIAVLALMLPITEVIPYKRNYEAKYSKSDVPLWKQRACEKAQKYKANSHYNCDDKGDIKCLPGWQGDLCQVPMCRNNCDPMNGYCQRPGECRCRIGYTGESCEKCIPLPGCQHGDCTKPFECICRPGWDGLFCTEPTCRQGCHSTRGYCESPNECRCRIGWAGRNCSDCSVLPGCQHGTCSKPLECNCLPGYTGLLCQTPICNADCNKQHGYCKKPGECRCKVGWTGQNCDKCFPYPGCVNGDCEKPWECNCKPGWGGMLCDEKLTYCKENPNICENNGKCVSLTKEDGSYRCHCKQGYLGKNCEIIDEFLLTSTVAPRITPPPTLVWEDDELEEEDEDNDIKIPNAKEDAVQIVKNETLANKKEDNQQNNTSSFQDDIKNFTLNLNINLEKGNTTQNKPDNLIKPLIKTVNNINTTQATLLPTLQSLDIYGSDIIGTATATMNLTKTPTQLVESTKSSEVTTANITTSIKTSSITGTTTNSPTTSSSTPSSTSSSTTISPLSKLDDDKNLHTVQTKPINTESGNNKDEDDDDDEECTEDDNDEDCEYEEDDEEEDDEEDDDDSK